MIFGVHLGSAGRGHRGQQKRVANAVCLDLLAQRLPVPQRGGGHTPHIKLELALAHLLMSQNRNKQR